MSLTVLILLGVSAAATFLFGKYAQHVGKRTESPTLIAEGKHRQMDVLSSAVVLASAAFSFADVHLQIAGVSIDQIGAVIVLSKVRRLIEAEPAVSQMRGLVGRNAG